MVPNGWEWTNLGKLANKVGSGVTPKGGSNSYKSSGIPLIRSQNVLWGTLDLKDVAFIDDSQHEKMKGSVVCKGDVLLNITGASIGRAAVSNLDEANVNQHVCIIRSDKLDPEFLRDFLLSFNGQKQIEQFQAGGNRQGLNFEQIKSFKLPLPPLSEQRKIAKILSTWDKAISTTECLIDNSKQQKKALMQQLLTGKKRLLDDSGKPFEGEWEDLYLQDVAKIIVSPVDKKIVEGEIPVELCNYTDVYYNTRITNSIEFMKATAKQSEIDKYTLQVNDVIITKDSETPGDIAIPALVSEDLGGTVCGYHLAIIRPNSQLVEGAYLNYLFSMQKTRYYFFTLATGATRFGLSIGGINKAHFTLPPLEEQQKIASVLVNADQEIELLEQQLADLKQEKKALMQQLLTGKRRVKTDDKEVA
tara:strand:- start:8215 stop:9468 length:1254 start_codon:yes stop_codon:yes gene_type:complete